MKKYITSISHIDYQRNAIHFNNGFTLYSNHASACCEHHYMHVSDLTPDDYEGLEFDLSDDSFFERIAGYGVALLPTNGYPLRIPCYGINNGRYSANLDLVLKTTPKSRRIYNITECQDISEG